MALDPNGKCTHGDRCKYTYHNIAEYMAAKLPDIGASNRRAAYTLRRASLY